MSVSLGWRLFGFFLLPLSVGLYFLLLAREAHGRPLFDSEWTAPGCLLFSLCAWPAGLLFLAVTKRLSWKRAAAVFGLTLVYSGFEMVLWLYHAGPGVDRVPPAIPIGTSVLGLLSLVALAIKKRFTWFRAISILLAVVAVVVLEELLWNLS